MRSNRRFFYEKGKGNSMITINFYKNGAYITGHSDITTCSVVSYAMWSCICDCLDEGELIKNFQSAITEGKENMGFTFVEINLNNEEHIKIFSRFRADIWCWVYEKYNDKVTVNDYPDDFIEWDKAWMEVERLETRPNALV